MRFEPYIFQKQDGTKIAVEILPASDEDLACTKKDPVWQSDWTSAYLSASNIDKFALKTLQGELAALGAYQISGRHAYVYILYLESAPESNPTMTRQRKYYGIGEAMIAFGIKYSIDHGCRGDVLFDAKTDELAQHYELDFGAKRVSRPNGIGPKRYMLADEEAWKLFSKFLTEEDA